MRTLQKGDILSHVFHGGNNNALEESYKGLLEAKEKGVILDLGFEGFAHIPGSDYCTRKGSWKRERMGIFEGRSMCGYRCS